MSIAYALHHYSLTNANPVKHEQWANVIKNMLNGSVTVGSRQPHQDFPVWATPEVAHGGFSTGRMRAGGDLAPYEVEMVSELVAAGRNLSTDTREQRAAIQKFLTHTEDGLRVLSYRLESKTYRVDVPEEGCLMVYAWLLGHGFETEARELLESVSPFFDRLRFHPVPTAVPQDLSRVSMKTVESVQYYIKSHACMYGPPITIKSATVGKTNLMFWDRFIRLWLSTLDNPQLPPTGTFRQGLHGRSTFHVDTATAWPCQVYPADWNARAAELIQFYELNSTQLLTGSVYTEAIDMVRSALLDRRSLTGRQVGRIRWWIASKNEKRGLPGSARYEEWLASSLANLETASQLPTAREFYSALSEIVQRVVSTADASTVCFSHNNVIDIEAQMTQRFPRSKLLKPLHMRLLLAMGMTYDELLQSPVVTSPESLTSLLETFASAARANQVKDESARYLFQQLEAAFSRRRSLLLLNYESQVKVSELPWVAALHCSLATAGLMTDGTQELKEFQRRTVGLTLRRFGERPVRNEFVRMLRTLFDATGTTCYLLEELAADIFMGGFVKKYGAARGHTKDVLGGTCYGRYYSISE